MKTETEILAKIKELHEKSEHITALKEHAQDADLYRMYQEEILIVMSKIMTLYYVLGYTEQP